MKEAILIVGSGAREHAIAIALARSPQNPSLLCFGTTRNPGIEAVCSGYATGSVTDVAAIVEFARKHGSTLAVIGPEAPLAAGLADALWEAGTPVVGPQQKLAQIESSKSFTRELLTRYSIPGNPRFQRFESMEGAEEALAELAERHVIKDDGLAGGKGVKVWGDHLLSHKDSLEYCRELVEAGHPFVIEEKLEGEEFSLLSFCDGRTLRHMPAVQDHKRAYEGDKGPNTGGMGTYTESDGKLPFLSNADVADAQQMNERVAAALEKECGAPYQGILYGGFMATAEGVRLIEYNARFGDPEALNLLTLLKTDFVAICRAVVEGKLGEMQVEFARRASVCKYVVPEGYPQATRQGDAVYLPHNFAEGTAVYLGGVVEQHGQLVVSGTRAAGFVAIAETLVEAEALCEQLAAQVPGRFFHRKDIGTEAAVNLRVAHMQKLRAL